MKTFKMTNLVLPLVVALSVFSFSCAKKAEGVRTIKQTQGKVMNAAVNTPSTNAGNAQGLLYTISVIDRPMVDEADPNNLVINAEIKTPAGRYIPVSTTHVPGKDVWGTYDDTDSGAKLDIRARCLKEQCATYVLLITVIKNGHSVHQILAISNSNEDFFNYENVNAQVAANYFYRDIDDVVRRKGL